MLRFWRRLTWGGRLVLLLMIWTLGMTAVANISLFQRVGKMGLGAWVYWEIDLDCLRISPVVSPHWPPFAKGQLHTSDCITNIDGKTFYYQPELEKYLTEEVAGKRKEKEVWVTGFGKEGAFHKKLPLIPWTIHLLLQAHLLNFIPGIGLWLIGLIVYLALSNEPLNQALASFFFLGGMVLMGLNHWVGDYVMSVWFDALISALPRPVMAFLLIKIALLFPESKNARAWIHKLYWIAFFGVLLALGMARIWSHVVLINHNMYKHVGALLRFTENGLFIAAGLLFLLRLAWCSHKNPSPKLRGQMIFLTLGVLSFMPILVIDLLNSLSGLLLPFLNLYNLTAMGWIIPGAAMVAYAMLRYQTFSYRGQFLSILLVFFISAVIVQTYTLVVTLGRIDGVQWALLWGAVLFTTLLFYLDSPLRRAFIRYFARHYDDYEVVVQFIQHLERQPSEEHLLQEAARALCRWLRVEWVAIWAFHTLDILWVASQEGSAVITQRMHQTPSQPPFENAVHREPLEEGGKELGMVWIGPRVSAEPFDTEDQRLAHLLTAELARMLALRLYISELESIPGRILAAVDQERQRIGRDLHDGVLQFLGALPLALERVKTLQRKRLDEADQLIEQVVEQVEIVSQETRGLAYDLSLPGLRQGDLLAMAHRHARIVCRTAGVRLNWQVLRPRPWRHIDETNAVHVYRILQEGLHNALRHGHPSQITVIWDATDEWLILDILDDGQGMDTKSSSGTGLGMISMRERARALGGRLEVVSEQGRGVRVRLIFRCKIGCQPLDIETPNDRRTP